jgi:hypothetical protein
MPNFKIIFLFFLFCLPGVAQEDHHTKPLSQGGGHVVIKGGLPPEETKPTPVANPQPESKPEATSTSPTKNAEGLDDIAELEKSKASRTQQVKQIEKTTEVLNKPILNPIEEMKKLGHQQITPAAILDKKVLEMLQKFFMSGVLDKISHEEVKKQMQDKLKGTLGESLFERYPGLLDLFAKIIRDKHALVGMTSILMRRDDLKTFFYIGVGLFLLTMYIAHRLVKPKWRFLRRLGWKTVINFCASLVHMGVFYFIFSSDITPVAAIILKHFFS